MTFSFGANSVRNLAKVKPELVQVAQLAVANSKQDFMVTCGLRSKEDQEKAVAAGNSRTMNSKHLLQPDGFSHAIDCVPRVEDQPTWDWHMIYPIVDAMHVAAVGLGFANNIRWGGVWDRSLGDFQIMLTNWESEVVGYKRRTGKTFVDGPHFEWIE